MTKVARCLRYITCYKFAYIKSIFSYTKSPLTCYRVLRALLRCRLLRYILLSVTWALVPLSVQMAQLQGAAAAQHCCMQRNGILVIRVKWVNFRKEDDIFPPSDLIFGPNNSFLGKSQNSKWSFQRKKTNSIKNNSQTGKLPQMQAERKSAEEDRLQLSVGSREENLTFT